MPVKCWNIRFSFNPVACGQKRNVFSLVSKFTTQLKDTIYERRNKINQSVGMKSPLLRGEQVKSSTYNVLRLDKLKEKTNDHIFDHMFIKKKKFKLPSQYGSSTRFTDRNLTSSGLKGLETTTSLLRNHVLHRSAHYLCSYIYSLLQYK